nr:immunoglobulin light chain junction region [Macaca mulatta]MOX69531.1 immunoglobulin light chain junction region [Macaca mulatta]MOX69670.1 immunoglobulin light chain junction region [Macaca mulatta]MOX69794.1 immunoglobulin light chain junction region [Macaca mulatta]MOX70033.1 immunoglobulin light chain junction region [Macaca mulatta]
DYYCMSWYNNVSVF